MYPFDNRFSKIACLRGFLSPSPTFALLVTKTMSDINLSRKPSQAAAISSIACFSEVRETFEINSKILLLFVNSCKGTFRPNIWDNSSEIEIIISHMSLNAMTSPDITDMLTCPDLYDFKLRGTTSLVESAKTTICPSCA